MNRVDGLVLAAGASRRLGRPKPLEDFDGKTALTRAVEAMRPHVDCVWAVVGHGAERVREAHADLDVHWILAGQWAKGMGATLSCAVGEIAKSAPDALVIAPCDLPGFDASIVGRLISAAAEPGRSASACVYENVIGIPVCVRSAWFDRFARLEGDRGARDRLRAAGPEVAGVDWPAGGRDRDRSL